jgi:Mg-chelatase subunit ChlD
MLRESRCVLIGALILCLASQRQIAQQTPSSPPQSNAQVQVFLTASGDTQIPSTSEVSVSIDKQPAQVTSVRSAKQDKLLFALLVDTSTSESKNHGAAIQAAEQLFQRLSSGTNEGYLVFFNTQVIVSKKPLQVADAQRALDGVKFGGGTDLYDAITETCTHLLSRSANPDSSRRAIFLLSDGSDNQSRTTGKEAIEEAQKEGVTIFSLTGATADPSGERFLQEAGRDTGGEVSINKNLGDGIQSLLLAVDRQWAVSIVSPIAPDMKPHSLAVRVSQKGIQLSTPAKVFVQ